MGSTGAVPAVHGVQLPCLHSVLSCCQGWLQKCRLLLDVLCFCGSDNAVKASLHLKHFGGKK